ncbi:TonB-dependent receptor [Mucilaginibacter ginkgonis]|uniref:TonB dependent receptor n=1 Tax=Mucilaginibacter ginkgonis TaxID=2682091 RepID=A0A6I4HWJ3_9SPHI|nr:hypothetical protein [Mucilaginibacter ginkgonis]QQL50052.1 hypothetical protein GO620_000960 [Mucilaginibacter ginkgonis]
MISTYKTGLIIFLLAFGLTASAQTQKAKPKTAAPAKKTVAVKKPTPASAKQKAAAKKLGDVAAKIPLADTTKKSGANNAADNKNGGSLSEEIIVTTSYKPVLADAVKIRRNPDLEDKTPYKAPLSYTSIDKRLERNTDIKQLEAMKLPAPKDSIPNNNYVKVGAGNLKTTFAELYVDNGRDAALQVGGWAKHLGQSGNDAYKQTKNRQEAGIFAKSINGENTVSGRITYNREQNYYYGFSPTAFTLATTPNPASQTYNTIGAEAELVKNFVDTDRVFDYALKAKGYVFSNANQMRENNLVINGFINQTVKQFYAGLSGTLDLASQKDAAYSINNNIFRANPYLKFQGDSYKIDAGVNIVTQFGNNSKVSIYPAAKAEVQVVPDYVRLFVEAKGDVNRASLRNFADENPFIGQNIAIANTEDQLDLTAGIKGTITAGLGFKALVFRNRVKNLPLFVSNLNTTTFNNQFAVVYDDGYATLSGFRAELDYKASSEVDIFGKGEYIDYKMANQLAAWNLPNFKLTAGAVLHITDKVDVNASLLLRGDTKDIGYPMALSPLSVQQTVTPSVIPSFTDVNAGVSYKVTSKVSVFVQANNLLNSNYRQWLYYRNYGFNIFGGVGFGF